MSATPTNLTIGIIGAGMIGEPLASHFAKAKHTVRIANSRGPETLTDVASRTGATATTVEQAVHNAHIVIVTIPVNRIPQLDKNLFMSLPSTTIILDTNNYYPGRDGPIPKLTASTDEDAMVESRWVEMQLGCPVIKVFNNIDAWSLKERGVESGSESRIALPVSGNDAIHKATVIALLNQIGFDGVDAGNVEASWRQQPGTPVYGTNYGVEGVRNALNKAVRAKTAEVRDIQVTQLGPKMASGESWENLYKTFREIADEQYGK